MAKSYSLDGSIHMVDLVSGDFQQFIPPIVDAVPEASMGTVSITITGEGASMEISGSSKKELEQSAAKFLAEMAAKPAVGQQAASTFDMQATLNLVHLTFAQGVGVIDAAMHNMPTDTLETVSLSATDEAA